MANKLLSITVQGKHNKYSFNFYGDTKHIENWRNEGFEIDEIVNTIPTWIVDLGLTKVWCKLQDWFNFKL